MENQEITNAQPSESANGGEQESFAELLEKSTAKTLRLSPGARVKAKIIGVSGDAVYLDLGGKSEAFIDINEFKEQDGTISIKEGDEIEATFVAVQDGARRLTTLVNGYSTVKLSQVRDAFEAGVAITGDVKREIKGGFEVMVSGVRCFCPLSQIDLKGGREGGLYVGTTQSFKVIEFSENGRNIVLSRRQVLQGERDAAMMRLKEQLAVGQELTGPVTSLQSFGAFVDIGGVEALIPVSELSWSKVDKPEDVLSLGQQVTAKLIALDWDKKRFTLSLKALQPDPWAGIADKYPVGEKIAGTVVRLVPFGAFVAVEPGIDGLIHISNFGTGRRINHPKEVVQQGQAVEAYVLAVDTVNKKLSLSLQPKKEPKKINYPAVGEMLEGKVEKVMPFGVFLKIDDSLTGLIPNSEMATPRGTDHAKQFPEGMVMKVMVVNVDTDKGKVTLSRKGIIEHEEQETFKKYRETVKSEVKSEAGLSAFGELLKAKLEEKQQG